MRRRNCTEVNIFAAQNRLVHEKENQKALAQRAIRCL